MVIDVTSVEETDPSYARSGRQSYAIDFAHRTVAGYFSA
jgi:hypothetical protein